MRLNLKTGLAITGVLLFGAFWAGYVALSKDPYSTQRLFQYSFTVTNTTNQLIEEGKFSTYSPLVTTSTQKLINISASGDYEIKKDKYGNQVMYFNLKNIPPYGAKIISVRAILAFTSSPVSFSESSNKLDGFLKSEHFVESDHPDIIKLAKNITRKQPESAVAIYDWVKRNIKDSGYREKDRGALAALKERKGDCTEYTYLFSALARASDIPTRNIGGFVYPGNAVFDPADYHNWAQAYQGGKWIDVDPHKKIFGTSKSHYIAMRIIVPDENMISGGLVTVSEGLSAKLNKRI